MYFSVSQSNINKLDIYLARIGLRYFRKLLREFTVIAAYNNGPIIFTYKAENLP